jgi:hypothetical protein
MMRKTTTLTTLLLLGTTLPALADTVIKTRSYGDGEDKVMIHGDWARMESAGESDYQLFNLKTGQIHMINKEEKTIMDFDLNKSGKAAKTPATVKVVIKKQGKGPKVAGYPTVKYVVTANGQTCGTEFISAKAVRNKDIKKLMHASTKLVNLDSLMPQGMAAAVHAMQDPCDIAEQDLMQKADSLGIPLKSIDSDGSVESETTSIDTHAKLDPKLFQMPADYRHTTMQQEMGKAMNEMQQMMQSIPPEGQEFLQNLFQGMQQGK